MLDVASNGALGDHQVGGDLSIRHALGDEFGDLFLTARQRHVRFLCPRSRWGSRSAPRARCGVRSATTILLNRQPPGAAGCRAAGPFGLVLVGSVDRSGLGWPARTLGLGGPRPNSSPELN